MDKRNRKESDKNSDEESKLLGSSDSRKIKDQGSCGSQRIFTVGSSSDTEYVGKCSSDDSAVFEGKVRTSTRVGLEPWSGKKATESNRLKRAHSWSAGNTDDDNSEVRILRERLVRTQTCPRVSAIRLLSRRQRLTLASLALVDFMSFCSMSIMAPFFPREASEKGLSDTMCGFVFSFYAVVMFLTSPLFGKFLPVVGAKFMFTCGMFIAGGCNVLFGTLVMIEDVTLFTVLCFLVRGLEALGASAYSTASYVFVVNSFPDNIGSVLGILETFVGLGMSVGPALGGLLYSIGGFGLPFYSLGIVMVFSVPVNFFLLDDTEEYVSGSKTGSIMRLFTIPSIIITGLVIVIVSNTWAFLDPTLEPHLRQFGLTTEQIGLIFLLFSSLYAIFSPIWGWVADRVHNHWCMMVWGLFLSALGLLLLGPCPFIPGLPPDLWLDLVALSILGMSVALTLLPTFQGVLTSSIKEGGCPEAVGTYSAVAGVWSCCYSLGEVIGPALGGVLTQRLGFSFTATICAAACFIMAVITAIFFSIRESMKPLSMSESLCSELSDTTWSSNGWRPPSESTRLYDSEPLMFNNRKDSYGTTPPPYSIEKNSLKRSVSANVMSAASYFIKFQYLSDGFRKILKPTREKQPLNKTTQLYNKKSYGSISPTKTQTKDENDYIEFLKNTRNQSKYKLQEPIVSFNTVEEENIEHSRSLKQNNVPNVYNYKEACNDSVKTHVANRHCSGVAS